MSEPNLNMKISIAAAKNRKPLKVKANLKDVIQWIEKKGYDPVVTNELIKILKNFPDGAYGSFVKNFNTYVAQAKKTRNES